MLQHFFLMVIGFCSGIVISGGVAGLLIGLSIVPRYAGVTHTGKHILLYEDITFLGITVGNLFFIYGWHIPGGSFFLILYPSVFKPATRVLPPPEVSSYFCAQHSSAESGYLLLSPADILSATD